MGPIPSYVNNEVGGGGMADRDTLLYRLSVVWLVVLAAGCLIVLAILM